MCDSVCMYVHTVTMHLFCVRDVGSIVVAQLL